MVEEKGRFGMAETDRSFATKKKQLLSEKIHDEILEMIVKNGADEETVLNEKRLVEVFGVSKAPVREALIKLCAEGVLKSVPRYGYVVVQQGEKDIREVLKMRVLLEQEALREGYEKIVDCHLPELLAQIEGTKGGKKEVEDIWQLWEDNKEFHLLLASYSRNSLLLQYLQQTIDLHKRIYAQQLWEEKKSMAVTFEEDAHKSIWQALAEKNLDKALELLKKDIGEKEDGMTRI